MNEQEKKTIDNVKNLSDGIQIPDSLKPEQIEQMLIENQKKKRWWKSKHLYRSVAAAAVLIVSFSAFRMTHYDPPMNIITIDDNMNTAKSYDDIYKAIKDYQKAQKKMYSSGNLLEKFTDIAMSESADDTSSNSAAVSEVFSDTNTRTEGVGEADIVKTDGTYLYILRDGENQISIVDVSRKEMKHIANIQCEAGSLIREFYVKDQKAVLFLNVEKTETTKERDEVYIGSETQVATYDLRDAKNPKLVNAISQSGDYYSSRIVGDYIYTFSHYSVYPEQNTVDEYIPYVNNELLVKDAIYMEEVACNQYMIITSMNLKDAGKIVDKKAVFTSSGECYVSGENIYIYEALSNTSLIRLNHEERKTDTIQTEIRKLSYKDGVIKGIATGVVDGYLKDSFCIDEYKGNLRLVTTIDARDTMTNSVYVLNEKLEKIGEINGIAQDERVYSARFFGETGYFVTYRETDPLFSVDFSDPANPRIIGKLKIPGFSEYLHPYGDGLLLGIGMDVDEEVGITEGVKVSMFDISNPEDVKEVDTYTIEDRYGADLFRDYKAVLVDEEKNVIGFSCYGNYENYYIFGYCKEDGFELQMNEEVNGNSYMCTRGLYIGDRLYVVKGNAVESYQMGSFEKVDDILL